MIDEREVAHLLRQNKKLKAKMTEQIRVFQEERARLTAINHALRASLENEQQRNRDAIENFNDQINGLEGELRSAQSDPPFALRAAPGKGTRAAPFKSVTFNDLEAEGQRLAEATSRIMRQCMEPQTTVYVPPAPVTDARRPNTGSSRRVERFQSPRDYRHDSDVLNESERRKKKPVRPEQPARSSVNESWKPASSDSKRSHASLNVAKFGEDASDLRRKQVEHAPPPKARKPATVSMVSDSAHIDDYSAVVAQPKPTKVKAKAPAKPIAVAESSSDDVFGDSHNIAPDSPPVKAQALKSPIKSESSDDDVFAEPHKASGVAIQTNNDSSDDVFADKPQQDSMIGMQAVVVDDDEDDVFGPTVASSASADKDSPRAVVQDDDSSDVFARHESPVTKKSRPPVPSPEPNKSTKARVLIEDSDSAWGIGDKSGADWGSLDLGSGVKDDIPIKATKYVKDGPSTDVFDDAHFSFGDDPFG